jgi:hypothetical protein
MRANIFRILACVALIVAVGACGDDGGGVPADTIGVGAQCMASTECLQPDPPCDSGVDCYHQVCLTQFTGGYCGIANCTGNADCPEGSVCVAHDDNVNYCFRRCTDKGQCNVNRDADNESNCSSNVVFVTPGTAGKACVPPSSGP